MAGFYCVLVRCSSLASSPGFRDSIIPWLSPLLWQSSRAPGAETDSRTPLEFAPLTKARFLPPPRRSRLGLSRVTSFTAYNQSALLRIQTYRQLPGDEPRRKCLLHAAPRVAGP